MRNRIALCISAMLILGLLAGLTTSALAGSGGAATVAKKKKKPCPPGTHKVVIKKTKNGVTIKKRKCVPNATTPVPTPTPAPVANPAKLTISPASFVYPNTQHGGLPCNNCTTQAFTVTNTGGAASGALAASIADVLDPVAGDDPAYTITANTCTAALAAGGTCSVSVIFAPESNGGDGDYVSLLNVTGAPGGTAQAQLTGHAD
jgi:hypothetical protein